VYKPRQIKEEESQRWVVMGTDPNAVDRLVDFQRMDIARQLELESRTTTPVPVPRPAIAPPIVVSCDPDSSGSSLFKGFVNNVFAAFVGAVILFYMMVYVL
jgi:hypothetical protein